VSTDEGDEGDVILLVDWPLKLLIAKADVNEIITAYNRLGEILAVALEELQAMQQQPGDSIGDSLEERRRTH